jgi:predicted DsbA family dithiol-disulfide isomerase
MQVEIYSDVVCPWCAIGKARFEAAVVQFEAEGGDPVEIVWRPFQLDPTAPATPSPVLDVYAKKFGGPDKAKQITDHVTSVAAAVGWTFDFSIAQRANTFDAHRLLAYALETGGPELQGRVKNALLRAYFTEGRNVGDPEELVVIGAAEGLDPEAVRAMLESGDYVRATREEMDRAVELGISAVPSFVFNGVGVLPGAQEPEQFLRVLRRLAAR